MARSMEERKRAGFDLLATDPEYIGSCPCATVVADRLNTEDGA